MSSPACYQKVWVCISPGKDLQLWEGFRSTSPCLTVIMLKIFGNDAVWAAFQKAQICSKLFSVNYSFSSLDTSLKKQAVFAAESDGSS